MAAVMLVTTLTRGEGLSDKGNPFYEALKMGLPTTTRGTHGGSQVFLFLWDCEKKIIQLVREMVNL